MGSVVIKASQDGDLYLLWSTNTDEPLAVGDRQEMAGYLLQREITAAELAIEERLARADQTGSSSRLRDGQWEDAGMVFRHRHLVPRARLEELAQRWMASDDDSGELPDISDLLVRRDLG